MLSTGSETGEHILSGAVIPTHTKCETKWPKISLIIDSYIESWLSAASQPGRHNELPVEYSCREVFRVILNATDRWGGLASFLLISGVAIYGWFGGMNEDAGIKLQPLNV